MNSNSRQVDVLTPDGKHGTDRLRGSTLIVEPSEVSSEQVGAIGALRAAFDAKVVIQRALSRESVHSNPACLIVFLPHESNDWQPLLTRIRQLCESALVVAIVDKSKCNHLESQCPLGADEFLVLPSKPDEVVQDLRRIIYLDEVSQVDSLRLELYRKCGMELFVGNSECFVNEIRRIPVICQSDAPVLIIGDTGTGKDLYARAVHYLGCRSGKPFIPVNCGAIPEHLFENELFGHARGAYTDASEAQRGLIHEADGGTLFLDEINTLNLHSQVKLLRFLEDRKYKALGSSRYVQLNMRIIAAANVELSDEIRKRRFREDLYHRINILIVRLPSLRARQGDVRLLAQHFLDKFSRCSGKREMFFSQEALNKLVLHDWPGNVRELENMIERLVVMARSNIIRSDDIDIDLQFSERSTFKDAKNRAVIEFEKNYLSVLLQDNDWNISHAAKEAHKDRRSLQRLIRKHHLHHAASM